MIYLPSIKNSYVHHILLIILLFIGFPARGELIVNIGDKYGMPIRKVTSLCKDADGFVYGVSNQGVVRISSSDCRLYPLPLKSALFLAQIYCIGNDVYVSSHSGQTYRYDRVHDAFVEDASFRDMIDEGFLEMYDVCVTNDSTLYVSTNHGVLVVKDGKLVERISDNSVRSVLPLTSDEIIYVTEDGVSKCTGNAAADEEMFRFPKKEVILAAFYDNASNKLWLGTLANGVYIIDLNKKDSDIERLSAIDTRQPVRALVPTPDNTVLVGVDGSGVYEVNITDGKLVRTISEDIDDPRSLRGNGVNDILYTPDKTWIATYTGGISYIDNSPSVISVIRHVPGNNRSLANNQVNPILQDSKGRVWFGTDDGVSCWDMASDKWFNYLERTPDNEVIVLGLCEDDDNNIWVGTYGSGIYVLDYDTGAVKAHFDKSDDTSCQFVFDIFKDSDGDIWIGASEGGASMYSVRDKTFTNYPVSSVYSFIEPEKGKLLGVGSNGAAFFDKKAGRKWTAIQNDYDIQQCYFDGKDYWLATSCHGLVKYNIDTGEGVVYGESNGIPSNTVSSLLPLSETELLLGTENGLCRFDIPSSTAAVMVPGVASNLHSIAELSDGTFLIGTSGGVIQYNHRLSTDGVDDARIYLQDISVGGRSIHELSPDITAPVDQLEKVNIEYTKDLIVIEALYLGGTPRYKLQWKLEGLDSDWSAPASKAVMSYANIPWGEYTLKVRLLDTAEDDVIEERNLRINVQPPFWATWWFIAIAALALLVLLVSVLYIGMKRMKERYLEEKLRFITQTMLEMQGTINIMKATLGQHKDLGIESSERSDYYIKLLNRQADRLSLLFAQLFTLEEEESAHSVWYITPKLISQRMERRMKMMETARQDEAEAVVESTRRQPETKEKDRGEDFVAKAMEVLRKNISDSEFGKDEFASAMCVSPSLLYKKIKAETGLSIVDFIKSMRMNYAMELLKTHQYTMTQISEMCGFSSVTYFGVVFKKYYGVSPTEIQETND